MEHKGKSIRWVVSCGLGIISVFLLSVSCVAQQVSNGTLVVTALPEDGLYRLQTRIGGTRTVLTSRVGAEIDHKWVRSNDYPQHKFAESTFHDVLGSGGELKVTCTGLRGEPDLVYLLRLYAHHPYATVQVEVRNYSGVTVTVQALRTVEAVGHPVVNLGGHESTDRVLSDGFASSAQIDDLGLGSSRIQRGVGSQLIYNRESKQSLFLGTLTADRFVTVFRLGVQGAAAKGQITSYSVDSTGTTELMPTVAHVALSLVLKSGESMASEQLMMAAGPDYLNQLLSYGQAIRRLHNARVSGENLLGWWSWTSYYMTLNEGAAITNAEWLARNLKSLGYDYLMIDEGYDYAIGEYSTPNATKFPHGLRSLGNDIRSLGLKFGLWVSPFEVSNRAWVYEHHKDWLVHTKSGTPIPVRTSGNGIRDTLYALDTTNPEAQEYLRNTYRILVRSWGVHYIKLDFLDSVTIEGYRYQPNTTGFEAYRIGLEVIRRSVGDDVILDKDGGPMLTPVGLTDAGRISSDTTHNFRRTKSDLPGIAAHFYMNRNFYISDPDAFNLCDKIPYPRGDERPITFAELLTLQEAQVSIMVSEISGGMHEIGDDLPTLGAEKDRLALVENLDLLTMAKLSRASTPIDLLSFRATDEEPSVFFLQEDQRQSILTVFNWTSKSRSDTFKLVDFGLPAGHAFQAFDILNNDEPVRFEGGIVRLDNQAPHSVRVIKLIDSVIPAAAPKVAAIVPSEGKVGEPIKFSARADSAGVPALSYRWEFGDGTIANGPIATHTFTKSGHFTVRLTVEGLDRISFRQGFPVSLIGTFPRFDVSRSRRYVEPSGR